MLLDYVDLCKFWHMVVAVYMADLTFLREETREEKSWIARNLKCKLTPLEPFLVLCERACCAYLEQTGHAC